MAAFPLKEYVDALFARATTAFSNALANIQQQITGMSVQQSGIPVSGLTVAASTSATSLTTGNTVGTYTPPGSTNVVKLVPNSIVGVKGVLVGQDTVTGDTGAWDISFAIKQRENAATTTIVGTPIINLMGADTAFVSIGVVGAADTTNGALSILVTNSAGWTNVASFEAILTLTSLS